MRMIPMLKVKESKTPVLDNPTRSYSDPVKDRSFKSEYENIAKEVEKIEKKSEEVSLIEPTEKKDTSDKTPVVYKENNKKDSSEDIKIIKQVTANLKPENSDTKNIKIAGKSKEKSLNSKEKSISKILSGKRDSEKRVKETDKNSLNQSIAASLNTRNAIENKAGIKKNSNKEDTIVKDSLVQEGSNKLKESSEKLLNTDISKNDKKINDKDKLTKKDKTKKNESKIKVADFRSELNKADGNRKSESVKNSAEQNIASGTEVKPENIEQTESGADKTIVLGTTELSAEGEGGKAQAPVMKEASALLKQQLKDFGNNEIVKQSRFILKDNNVGEIKLILKPEALGQVKINLNLNENSLAGQIVVENNSVKEVFQENINQLSRALEEEGFDSAKLDVSLNDKRDSDSRQKGESKQYFSERLKRFDNNGQVVRYGAPTVGINLTA